ncbi:MAG TPA: protein kinase [Chloroflexaceae bacterium]|nr:protein kinase [Chloroflexaceae bacterium]
MANVGQTVRLRQPGPPDCGAAPGDLLGGRFRLRSVVGHGGQAVVFAAEDQARPGAPVAVKVARRDLPAAERAEAVAVLRWEGGLLRRMRHRALPRLYKLEAAPRATWLARDLVPGEPLLALARRGAQDQRRVLAWATQLCDLLTYLHTREVPLVAGDLKPANLVLRPDGALALVDLGAAHSLTRRPPRRPRPRHGTPGYAPPEQLGSWGHDERADVFALAVTCYELLTGLDPAAAPLQFDLARLDAAAPRLAPALRWALELDPARRCPTAAALRSRLGAPAPPPPLLLGGGVAVGGARDLDEVIRVNPRLVEPAVSNGALERWLATSPDATLGALRYSLRAAQRAAPARGAPLETLLAAMAPADGSPLLQFDPPRLQLGEVPLRSWRVWGRPQPLVLRNTALAPLRWELSSPARRDADVRVLVAGRPQRQAAGVIAPGERLRLDVVAMANNGPRAGDLQLRCGRHAWAIPWEAAGRPGVPVGGRHVARLEDLDLGRPDLVPALEQLLAQGALARWLKATGRRALAAEVDAAAARDPGELSRRLLVGRILNGLAPDRFPALRVRGLDAASRPITAGEPSYALLQIDNLGARPCPLVWRSRTAWARVAASPQALGPGETGQVSVRLHPPRGLRGAQPVALELEAGALPLALVLPVQVSPDGFWQRLRRLFG